MERLTWWRLFVLNVGYRLVELVDGGGLLGETLVDRIRSRWQAPHRQGQR